MKSIVKLKIFIIIFFIIIFSIFHCEITKLDMSKVYVLAVLISIISDKYFYSGQQSENNKKYKNTSNFLAFTWFGTILSVLIEYIISKRNNLYITATGIVLVIIGIIIRGIAIKTLGKYFSRDVECWSNQKIIKNGIYKNIRHPSYLGNTIQIIGFPFILNSYYSLGMSIFTVLVFIWRINVEEKFMLNNFLDYKEYMRKTKRMIPYIW